MKNDQITRRMISSLMLRRSQIAAISSLAGMNMASAAITAAGSILLARLVPPSTFGVYAFASQAALTIYPFLTLRYEHALPLLGRLRVAKNLLFFSTVFLSCSLTALVLIVSPLLLNIFMPLSGLDASETSIFPAVVLAAGSFALVSIFQQSMIAEGFVHRVGISKTFRAVFDVALQVTFVIVFSGSALLLLVADTLANAAQAAFIGFGLMGLGVLPRLLREPATQLRRAAALMKRHKVFPLVTLPHMVIHGLLWLMIAHYIGVFFGDDNLGQYYLMRKMVFGFLGVIGLAASQYAISVSSQLSVSAIYYTALRTLLIVMMVALPSAAALGLFGPFIFALLGGEEWTAAGQIAAASIPLVILEPATAALAFVAVFLGRQGVAFLVAVAQGLVGLASVVVAGHAGWSMVSVVFTSSLAMALVMALYISWLLLQARQVLRTASE